MDERGRTVCEFRWFIAGEQLDPLDPKVLAPHDGWWLNAKPPSQKSRRHAEAAAAAWEATMPSTSAALEKPMEERVRLELASEQMRLGDTTAGLVDFDLDAAGLIQQPQDFTMRGHGQQQPTRLTLPNSPALRWEKVTAVLDKLAAAFPGREYLELTVPAFVRCFS
jgi:hypothetical protein